jgi:mannose-6-phosphate isomerase
MSLTEKIYKLRGKLMHYAWGGYTFLPSLLGIKNEQHQPFAEYWMGAHSLASSELLVGEKYESLSSLIKENPIGILSEKVYAQFGELPYLLKLQDVKDILSIQVHPTKEEAEKGFDRETAAGIPLNAPYRNYKDRNHKPEMLVALSEFWLLHGFKALSAIEELLSIVQEFNILKPLFKKEGLQSLYQFVMEMQQPEINTLLTPLVKREMRQMRENALTRDMPGWWVAKLYSNAENLGDIDRAVFSIYILNIVHLHPGEGLFQGAGIPHAYMEGQCVELMANSDNVLRAGLTPKHIDVPELIKHTQFSQIIPAIMKGIAGMDGEKLFLCPVNDFGMAKIELTAGHAYTNLSQSLEIMVVTKGGVLVNHSMVLKAGEAMAILPGTEYTIESSGVCELFKAFVPQT